MDANEHSLNVAAQWKIESNRLEPVCFERKVEYPNQLATVSKAADKINRYDVWK